jgi:squalene-hopene/tetraprenyl-beta-curcumene cyclase
MPRVAPDRLRAAYRTARDALLAERTPDGHWIGELSSSALATAVAVGALALTGQRPDLIAGGLRWLADTQNADGGWGDTTKSFSNISTTMLCRAAFRLAGAAGEFAETLKKADAWLAERYGKTPAEHAEAVRQRYGKDRTFSVPILMTSALAGLVDWREVPPLPFELACLPQSWYRFARLPVVSYALPALIAIGQAVHHHRPPRNPLTRVTRRLAIRRSLHVLERIQPSSGGFLEAIPLTSFVVMGLAGSPQRERGPARRVIEQGIAFIAKSVRANGSWPIDSNLATWVTTLAVNALAAAGDLDSLDKQNDLRDWLLKQQFKERHPYTGADPGGWGWTDLPGSVPDCDDTPGAMLALFSLRAHDSMQLNSDDAAGFAFEWLHSLQNRDGGWPTFCRGWGTLAFDRSGVDLTAHVLRAFNVWRAALRHGIGSYAWWYPEDDERGLEYLQRQQRPDGSWLPLWFGNQHAHDENPTYGTARVLAAYCDLGLMNEEPARRGVAWLVANQNDDGGWGGGRGTPSSVEETALAVEVLIACDATPQPSPPPQGGRGKEAFGRREVRYDTSNVLSPPPLWGTVRVGGNEPPVTIDSIATTVDRGLAWLVAAVESGALMTPSPIGFYFSKLWYFERLYPIIFSVAALGRACRQFF